MPNWRSRAERCRRRVTARSSLTCSTASSIRHSPDPKPRRPARPDPRVRDKGLCATGGSEMLGRLNWSVIPWNEKLPLFAGAGVVVVILAVLALVTVKGWWPYLWREWLTSVD